MKRATLITAVLVLTTTTPCPALTYNSQINANQYYAETSAALNCSRRGDSALTTFQCSELSVTICSL